MKIRTLMLVLTIFLGHVLIIGLEPGQAIASQPEVEWTKTYGGSDNEWASSLIQTSDGGYVLAGGTRSYGAGGLDFWLVKTDHSGNMEWSENYGGSDSEWANSLIQTSDGGYVLAGYTWSYGAGGDDFWLVKLSPTEKPTNWPLICGVIIAVLAIITVAVLYRRAR